MWAVPRIACLTLDRGVLTTFTAVGLADIGEKRSRTVRGGREGRRGRGFGPESLWVAVVGGCVWGMKEMAELGKWWREQGREVPLKRVKREFSNASSTIGVHATDYEIKPIYQSRLKSVRIGA